MPKIKQLSLENPLLASTFLMLLAIAFTELPLEKALSDLIGAQSAFYVAAGLEQFLFSLLLILFIKRLGLWNSAGFNSPRHWKSVWLIWPAILTHALFDMAGALQEISVGGTFHAFHDITSQVALVSIAFTLPLFLYGLFILRKVQVEQVSPAETLPLKFDLVKPF